MGDGPTYLLDTSLYFVVCANYLNSVYGSSGLYEFAITVSLLVFLFY